MRLADDERVPAPTGGRIARGAFEVPSDRAPGLGKPHTSRALAVLLGNRGGVGMCSIGPFRSPASAMMMPATALASVAPSFASENVGLARAVVGTTTALP